MTPNEEALNQKAKEGGMGRAARRALLKDLRRAAIMLPDMANEHRAKRKAKRRQADATRRKQR